MWQTLFHVFDLEELMENLERLALLVECLLVLVEGLGQVWTCEVAEVTAGSLDLAQSLHVRVLLSGGLQVHLLQTLAAQGVLVQSQVEEGLLLVQVASALGVLE